MEKNLNLDYFKKYGDRTSSGISYYSHFKSIKNNLGEIRFIEKKNLIAVSNEPFAEKSIRPEILDTFFQQRKYKKFDKLAFPISLNMANSLKDIGYNVLQIGIEPVFNLKEYFSKEDYLQHFPIARALKKRGATVKEINESEIFSLKDKLNEIKEEWLGNKKLSSFEFLNVVEFNELNEFKRFFILEDKNKIVAFLTALPIFYNGQVIGYFFNDIIKGGNSRSATNELLIIESMRLLKEDGVFEVRLGMCPLAGLNENDNRYILLNKIFDKWAIGYNFKGLYQFKSKLKPTSWRPVFLASNNKKLAVILINVMRLHLTAGAYKEFFIRSWYSLKQNLKLNEKGNKLRINNSANTFLMLLQKTKATLFLSSFFICLHILKNNFPLISDLFNESAFTASHYNLKGLILGPLFHNHAYHLIGDQISFILFGALIEYWYGTKLFLLITSLGLWISNPLTHLFLSTNLKLISPNNFEIMKLEKDYGSSNAVFAFVGAIAFSIVKKSWLMVPMLFHAFFISFQRESFLSIHHFVGMYMGYACLSWIYLLKKNEKIN